MEPEAVVGLIEQQQWLEPVETALQKTIAEAYRAAGPLGRHLKNFYHGTWLGHPLHPVLTDIPLGAWTATVLFDLLEASGHKQYRTGADVTLKLGLAGAVLAAKSGVTDWHVIDAPARRVGLIHGILNLASMGLFTASLLARNRRDRQAGRVFALAGFIATTAAAYLGGNLVYSQQIGANHAAGQPLPQDWTPAIAERDLPEGQPRTAEVNGAKLLLLRRDGQIYCISNVCSHLGGPLAEGTIEGDTVTCPWHGSRFCVRDGSVIDGPATHPEPSLETRVQYGHIEVKASSAA